MKKSVFTYQVSGSNFSADLEILLDIKRDLSEDEKHMLYKHAKEIIGALHAESIRLDPDSKKQAEDEKAGILSLFGDKKIYVEEIPNGYCSESCCRHLPWFIITTNKGRIKIGWRKRVIQIDWSDSLIKEDSRTLFPEEDVPKWDKVIHAWGLEKAKEYIIKLLS